MSDQAISLQKRLIHNSMISSILAGFIALMLLVGFAIYQSMNTHDNLMDEISDMLLVSDLSMSSGAQVDELSKEFDIYYQFKSGQQLLSKSEEFPNSLMMLDQAHSNLKQRDSDYSFIWRDGTLWRSYHFQDNQRQLYVDIYQDVTERFGDFFQSFFAYIGCLLLLWLIQWGMLHYVIKKQFRPIIQLSQHIAEKNADDLSPIHSRHTFVELQPILKQLNLLLARVQHSLEAEQRFTADASHELRSPLSAIQMRLQLLQRRYATEYPQGIAELKHIEQDVQRGTQTLENLLLLARLDPSDPHAVEANLFDLQSLLQDVVDATQLMAKAKNVSLDIQLSMQNTEKELGQHNAVMLYANRELMFICLRNLIDNAIRYAEHNGHILIRYAEVHQGEASRAGQLSRSKPNQKHRVYIDIEDDGEQLTQEVLSRMGERFYRALGTKTQGSGLGLSICYKIMQLQQGQMTLSRSDMGGLKVRLELPTGSS